MKKPTTIKDVAREAGVSVTTVSHALNGFSDVNENTRQRIIEIADRMEYVPNANGRALAGKHVKTLALMISGDLLPNDDSGITYGLISGIYNVALREGYEFEILAASDESQRKEPFMRHCRRKDVSGVVIMGLSTTAPYYEQISESQIPCVLLDADVKGKYVRKMAVNNEKAAFEATNHLLDEGYKNIAMINGNRRMTVSQERCDGYRRALGERGIPIDEKHIIYCDFIEVMAKERIGKFMEENPDVDAFFCASDSMAKGAIEGLLEKGYRVPEDIGIIGFDDSVDSKYVHGGISTIAQYPFEMGIKSAEAIVDMLNGKGVPEWIELNYQLIERKTSNKSEK